VAGEVAHHAVAEPPGVGLDDPPDDVQRAAGRDDLDAAHRRLVGALHQEPGLLVDITGENAGAAYRAVRRELAAYGGGVAAKSEIVALSKVDAVDEATLKSQRERLKRAMREHGPPLAAGARRAAPLDLSAVTGRGVKDVLRAALAAIDAKLAAEAGEARPEPAWTP